MVCLDKVPIMTTWDDRQKAVLEITYPGWDIWFVHCYPYGPGTTAWCAKPKGTPVAMFNAWSPKELDELIQDFMAEAI